MHEHDTISVVASDLWALTSGQGRCDRLLLGKRTISHCTTCGCTIYRYERVNPARFPSMLSERRSLVRRAEMQRIVARSARGSVSDDARALSRFERRMAENRF